MKYLIIYLLLLLGTMSCAQQKHGLSGNKAHPVVYKWNPDTTLKGPNGKTYLEVGFKSKDTALCHLAFRLFLLENGTKVPTSIKSDAYIGSFSLGMSCEDTFRVLIPQRFFSHHGTLAFTVIPLSPAGNPVTVDLIKNLSFRILSQ